MFHDLCLLLLFLKCEFASVSIHGCECVCVCHTVVKGQEVAQVSGSDSWHKEIGDRWTGGSRPAAGQTAEARG